MQELHLLTEGKLQACCCGLDAASYLQDALLGGLVVTRFLRWAMHASCRFARNKKTLHDSYPAGSR